MRPLVAPVLRARQRPRQAVFSQAAQDVSFLNYARFYGEDKRQRASSGATSDVLPLDFFLHLPPGSRRTIRDSPSRTARFSILPARAAVLSVSSRERPVLHGIPLRVLMGRDEEHLRKEILMVLRIRGRKNGGGRRRGGGAEDGGSREKTASCNSLAQPGDKFQGRDDNCV